MHYEKEIVMLKYTNLKQENNQILLFKDILFVNSELCKISKYHTQKVHISYLEEGYIFDNTVNAWS